MNTNKNELPALRLRIKAGASSALATVMACGFLLVGPAAAQTPFPDELPPSTIRMLQHSLIQGGYAVDSTDGVWGPKTAAAVREFQRVRGLQPTGRPDAQTLAALGVPGPGAAQGGDRVPPLRKRTPADLGTATIRAIQQALDKLGLQAGPVDGVWGERTVSAIGNLQRARGMPASGELDAHTLAALGFLPVATDRPAARRPGQALGAADLDPAAIRMIQQALSQQGFLTGSADGVWGENTVSALRAFQRAQGMETLGEPDVYTLAALGLLPGDSGRRR
jgi:peptidoglycan hydrolase-like protein with peptidoglycan-binding domain